MNIRNALAILLGIIIVLNLSLLRQAKTEEEQQKSVSAPAFTLARMVIAERVEDREPIGVAETFSSSTERVYCFIEATNVEEDTQATFVWCYGGKEIHTFDLPLKKGPRWRMFSYKNLRGQKGDWKVEIKDSAGNVIKTVLFIIF
jgi:hypothetical protein